MTMATAIAASFACMWLPSVFAFQVTSGNMTTASSAGVATPSSQRTSTSTLLYEQPAGNIVTLNRDTADMPGTTSMSGDVARTVVGFFKTSQTDSFNIYECGTPGAGCGASFAMGHWFGEHGTSSQGMTCHTWCGCYSNPVGKSSQSVSIDSDTWYHFGHVYDGTTHSLYFNGALFSSGTDSNNPLSTSATGCVFGSKDTRFSFDGQVKSVKVYLGALSASDIVAAGAATGDAGGATAVGDPHLENVHGERFDLMKEGNHLLINIPRGLSAEHALLRVQGDARRLGGQCADIYFQELNITGKWADAKQTGGFRYHAQEPDVNRAKHARWVRLGSVQLKVAHGLTREGTKYLNLYAKNLGHAGYDVGGLLGEDDHSEAEESPKACRKLTVLKASASVPSVATEK